MVVVQEIFGVNAHVRSVADRFAAEGYLAIAPALFDRVSPKFRSTSIRPITASIAMRGAHMMHPQPIWRAAGPTHSSPNIW